MVQMEQTVLMVQLEIQDLKGPIGLTGPQGATGPAGADGTDGIDGIDGAVGATGPQGPIGLTGATGPQGATGLLSNGAAAGNTPYWDGSQWMVNNSKHSQQWGRCWDWNSCTECIRKSRNCKYNPRIFTTKNDRHSA